MLYSKSPSDRGDLRSFLQLSLNEWLKMVAIRLDGHRLCGRLGVHTGEVIFPFIGFYGYMIEAIIFVHYYMNGNSGVSLIEDMYKSLYNISHVLSSHRKV